MYSGRITSLFPVINLTILLASPAESLHCREHLRPDAILMPRSLTHCTLSSLVPFISYSKIWFLVPTCKMWNFLTKKDISLWDHSEIFLRSSWWLILSCSVIIEFSVFVLSANSDIKFDVDVVYANYHRTGPKTKSCGTPLVTGALSEAVPLLTTFCSQLLSQFSIHFCTVSPIPSCLTLNINLCGTLSDAF